MNEVNHIWKEVFFIMPNWKWVFLASSLVCGLFLRPVFEAAFARAKTLEKIRSLHPMIRYFMDQSIQTALAWVAVTILWQWSIEGIDLPTKFEKYLLMINQLGQSFYLLRLAYLGVEALGLWIEDLVKKTENTLDDQLAPLATKTLKVFVVVFGVLIILQGFGFNVMSLLAGLGLGGLALALAAQDTAANVFGSITIILDRPFQVGDWVKIGDTEGNVEEIGFRSTRIRTFYQSVVSIPNSLMAKERIDNMGVRPCRRIRHNIGITYDTPNMKLMQFMEQIRYYLNQNPQVKKDAITVNFNLMGDYSLQVFVQFFVTAKDSVEEMEIQQDALLEIKSIGERMGIGFAYPTHTLQFAGNETLPTKI
jgi:MscS family membrane protein